jgi:hypothetical protein
LDIPRFVRRNTGHESENVMSIFGTWSLHQFHNLSVMNFSSEKCEGGLESSHEKQIGGGVTDVSGTSIVKYEYRSTN